MHILVEIDRGDLVRAISGVGINELALIGAEWYSELATANSAPNEAVIHRLLTRQIVTVYPDHSFQIHHLTDRASNVSCDETQAPAKGTAVVPGVLGDGTAVDVEVIASDKPNEIPAAAVKEACFHKREGGELVWQQVVEMGLTDQVIYLMAHPGQADWSVFQLHEIPKGHLVAPTRKFCWLGKWKTCSWTSMRTGQIAFETIQEAIECAIASGWVVKRFTADQLGISTEKLGLSLTKRG